jgi:hypothetical protein
MVVGPLAPGAVTALSAAAPQDEDENDHGQDVERRMAQYSPARSARFVCATSRVMVSSS